jgi:hypothetical protein
MDNPQKLATLGTPDTGHRTKTNEAKHNTENYKDEEQQNVGHHYMYNNIN